MVLDTEQSSAVEQIGKSLVVTAGAGSGKTMVLVERYIKLISEQVGEGMRGPERIIAITFTEKAAAQMRRRVEQALREKIASEKNPNLKSELKDMLERLPSARISTIDSFCANLVRRYPMYAEVHPDFAVLEPADAETMRYEAVRQALDDVIESIPDSERDALNMLVIDSCGSIGNFLYQMQKQVMEAYCLGTAGIDSQMTDANRYLTQIRNKASRIFEGRMSDMKVLDFAVIEEKAVGVLATEAGDEIRSSIDQVLVDEYQDVNTVQDKLIRGLVAGPDVEEKAILESGKLFIVGDEKQSIYKFRGAEPSIFRKWAEEAKSKSLHIHLKSNYRSNPMLIDFSNCYVNEIIGAKDEMSIAGRKTFSSNGADIVKVIACAKESDGNVYDKTVEVIVAIAGNAYSGKSEGEKRLVGYKDMALLTPSNHGMDPYIEALKKRNIPVSVMKSGTFYQSDSVAFIVSLLGIAINDTDDISAYQLLASPSYAIREASIALICKLCCPISACFHDEVQGIRTHFEDDDEYRRFIKARQVVQEVRRMRNSLSTRQILEWITEELFFEEDVLKGYGRRGVANFRKLIEISSNPALSLGNPIEFLNHLISYRDSGVEADEPDILDDDEDAIKVMTIHKSKGLEFPVVIIGDGNYYFDDKRVLSKVGILPTKEGGLVAKASMGASADIYSSREEAFFNEQKAEKRRLIYVAATRAEELLIISGMERRKYDNEGKPQRDDNCFFAGIDKIETKMKEKGIKSCVTWNTDMEISSLAPVVLAPTTAEESGTVAGMLLRSNDRVVRFSPSSLMSYLNCPKDFLRRQWYRLPEEEAVFSSGRNHSKAHYKASDLGTIVHFIAEHSENSSELPEAWEKAEVAFGSLLTGNKTLAKKAKEVIMKYYEFIENKAAKKPMKEVSFAVELDGFILEGIIDRIEEDNDGGWVITDLKTNNLEASSEEELSRKYAIQLESYMLAAHKALGSKKIKSRLLFLTEGKKVESGKADFQALEEKLVGIMKEASPLPERCRTLDEVCRSCSKRGTCEKSPYHSAIEDYSNEAEIEVSKTNELADEV